VGYLPALRLGEGAAWPHSQSVPYGQVRYARVILSAMSHKLLVYLTVYLIKPCRSSAFSLVLVLVLVWHSTSLHPAE
jgi:hypothetical protein